ncbi:MAG TPA: thioredoxin domain-containing protein [Pyrinomonadaceae bacterium]|jgi:protein-disulfide isomerase
MKFITAFFCLLVFTFSLSAQKADELLLATTTKKNFFAADLSPEAREMWLGLPKRLAEKRTELFEKQIGNTLLELEATTRRISIEKLFEIEVAAKVAEPSDAQIMAIYDANRTTIGGRSLSEMRPQIVAFLRREPEEKALQQFVGALKIKYKFVSVKDINAPNLKSSDALATAGAKTITFQDFENANRRELYELEAEAYDRVSENLKATVLAELLEAEAAASNASPSDILAREITDKMREYTEDERQMLKAAFEKNLLAKYKTQFLIKEPEPFVQKISTDDDPSQGSPTAPVTIVMFSDFQCSHCAAAHPVLKKVIAEYKDKIRFVVRDFPLETIHADAFRAAVAANAAAAQGKFFEYIELLYQNQNALDTESLKKYAADLGLNPRQFELDLGNEKFAAEVRKDMADGKIYGINGTPAIFVNGVKVRANSVEAFRNAIERALKK